MSARLVLLLSVVALAPASLAAQEPLLRYGLGAGTVVRLHLTSGSQEQGKLLTPVALDSATFRYCLYPAPPCTPQDARYRERLASDIRAVDVHKGTRAGLGALLGLPVGFVVGAVFIDFAESAGERQLGGGENTAILMASGAAFAGIGALIGGSIDRWVPAR